MTFHKGQRVTMTDEGRRSLLPHRKHGNQEVFGTVTSEPKDPTKSIRVRRDGSNYAINYHPSLWMPLKEPMPGETTHGVTIVFGIKLSPDELARLTPERSAALFDGIAKLEGLLKERSRS